MEHTCRTIRTCISGLSAVSAQHTSDTTLFIVVGFLLSHILPMGVFGFQIVLTMLVASFVHKMPPYYSFGRWFISRNLKYYTFVSNGGQQREEESGQVPVRTSVNGSKGRRRRGASNNRSILNQGKNVIHIKECPITFLDLKVIHFSYELKWMLDLLVAVVFVFIATSVYYYVNPTALNDQVNFSLIWVGFLTVYTTIILLRLTLVYLNRKLPLERKSQLVLSVLMVCCIIAILVVESSILEFNLSSNLKQINQIVGNQYNLSHGTVPPIIPMWCFKGFLGILGSVQAIVLVFPMLNYSRLHFESASGAKIFPQKSLQNISFVFPLICGSFWIKGTSNDTMADANRLGYYKVVAILILCVTRFVTFTGLMQTYFDRGKSVGMTGSKETIKNRMTGVFIFYCCIATQYLGPVVLLLMYLFLYTISTQYFNCTSRFSAFTDDAANDGQGMTITLFQGTFSFLAWWICFCMFILSSLGSVIHSYMCYN